MKPNVEPSLSYAKSASIFSYLVEIKINTSSPSVVHQLR